MKNLCMTLLFFVLLSLAGAEQIPVRTISWKPVPDQTELFAMSGKMYDLSCNEYGLTFYIREKTAGESLRVLIAPGSETEQGYLVIVCKAQPKRRIETGFHVVPGIFAENIEAEFRRDSAGKSVCRITVPWENLSTILPEKGLRVVIGKNYLPVRMPEAYLSAKKQIEKVILTAFAEKTYLHLKIQLSENALYREILKQYLNAVNNDSSTRVRYLRAVFTEVAP